MVTRSRRTTESIYQIKVTLKNIRPPIWRRIQVSSNTTLHDLHEIIQVVMGWYNCHLYLFEIGAAEYGDPDPDWGMEIKDAHRTRLSRVVRGEKTKFIYEYDMGDGWRHEILVEKVLPVESGKEYPVCVRGRRACPPEDCGGPWGYADFLEAIKDPEHDEHEVMLDWIGGGFDAETFDLTAVNAMLEIIETL